MFKGKSGPEVLISGQIQSANDKTHSFSQSTCATGTPMTERPQFGRTHQFK